MAPPASPSDVGALVAIGAGGLLLLALSLLAARKARRANEEPRVARGRAAKRTFAVGHAWGAAAGVASLDDALAALGRRADAPGHVESAAVMSGGSVRVAVRRKKSEPCELVAGYVTGLFESAWASDITMRHDACAGKAKNALCVYDVRPVSRRAAPAGAASSEGSRSGLHPWPPARPGGG